MSLSACFSHLVVRNCTKAGCGKWALMELQRIKLHPWLCWSNSAPYSRNFPANSQRLAYQGVKELSLAMFTWNILKSKDRLHQGTVGNGWPDYTQWLKHGHRCIEGLRQIEDTEGKNTCSEMRHDAVILAACFCFDLPGAVSWHIAARPEIEDAPTDGACAPGLGQFWGVFEWSVWHTR